MTLPQGLHVSWGNFTLKRQGGEEKSFQQLTSRLFGD